MPWKGMSLWWQLPGCQTAEQDLGFRPVLMASCFGACLDLYRCDDGKEQARASTGPGMKDRWAWQIIILYINMGKRLVVRTCPSQQLCLSQTMDTCTRAAW